MIFPALEEKLGAAKLDLDDASTETVVALCRTYLNLLNVYRSELHKIPTLVQSTVRVGSSQKEAEEVRKIFRAAIESTTRERETVTALLRSFTMVSGYEAVETFNEQRYKGYDVWELKSGGVVRSGNGGVEEKLTVFEAVEAASLLRRERHTSRSRVAISPTNTPTTSGAASFDVSSKGEDKS